MLVCSVIFQFLAAFLSFRFVLPRRLGTPWLLVSASLLIVGGLRINSLVLYYEEPDPSSFSPAMEVIEFAVSFLLGVGFLLTERWYLLKERLEGRFRLILDVDRGLIGVVDEEKILSLVSEGLAHGKGYRLVWIGTANPDGSVARGKSAGEGQGFLSEVPLRWDDTPAGGCPPGVAGGRTPSTAGRWRPSQRWPAGWEPPCSARGVTSFSSARKNRTATFSGPSGTGEYWSAAGRSCGATRQGAASSAS